ncbi:hypothetical protein GCM10027049_10640 [Mucilaginibacter puniceus]
MYSISKQVKYEVFKTIIQQPNPFGGDDDSEKLVEFLNGIWDLHTMPSTDSRYDNAYEDAIKHLVNNSDWDYDQTFIHRFKLVEDNDSFEKFITRLLLPEFRKDQMEIYVIIQLINSILETEGYKVVKSDYNNNATAIYSIQPTQEVSNLPIGIKRNNIPFHLIKVPNGRSDRMNSHPTPDVFPSFSLVFNPGWNDYDFKSEFSLFYYKSKNDCKNIGMVKIMTSDETTTLDNIPDIFTMLSDNFCSVGQNAQYYKNLNQSLGLELESVLFAIKDAAFFPEIHERFERKKYFINSLIRHDAVERNLRTIKYELNGHDLSNLYKFQYKFTPNFSTTPADVDFNFNNNKELPNRIYALIGKNGTGKTQFMTSLPMHISNNNAELFKPLVPIFSKVIAVSYSAFDNYQIPLKTASFNYVYCGVRDSNNELLSDAALTIRFEDTLSRIIQRERIDQWRSILLNFIQDDIIDLFLTKKTGRIVVEKGNNFDFNLAEFLKIKSVLSSGQKIIFYIISEIISHIRFDSLILYDEPETHLHPNAITELMNTIYELVDEFESYCIIATHSPLIIRELMSKNVFIIEKNGNIPSIRRIGIESFGENLTILTDEVFGNKSVPKQYKKIVQELVQEGKTYEDIITLLEFDEMPLSLNIRLYIKSLINNQNA